MTPPAAPDQIVRDILDANLYMVLATADQAGRPWSTPVYFAQQAWTEFYWVSSPHSTHSRNIAVRPEVAIVVFDSSARIGTGQGVYMSAVAAPVPSTEVGRAIEVFSRRTLRHGGRGWTVEDVDDTADLRLYRATAEDHWILAKDGQPDHRIPAHPPTGSVRQGVPKHPSKA